MRFRPRPVALVVTVGLAATALAACGGGSAPSKATASSASGSQLLSQTFTGTHNLRSGAVDVELTVAPSGSSTLTTPITFSFAGPFQDLGPGKVGNSDFTLRVSALGTSLFSAGLESLDGKGYVSLGTTSYRLPGRAYRQLEGHLSSAGSGSASSSGILGKLGIDPMRWLADPTVAGSGTVAGASTTHIRARLNVSAVVDDVGTMLGKAHSLGVPGASSFVGPIPPATKAKILAEVRSPRVDIWTGTSDKTLRRLALNLTLPVNGTLSKELGGMTSTALSLDIVYRNLGQPQTISPPASVQPYAAFRTRIHALLGELQGFLHG